MIKKVSKILFTILIFLLGVGFFKLSVTEIYAATTVQPSCSITYSPARLTLGSTGQVTLTTSNAFSNAASCSCTGLDSVSESFSIPSGTYPQSFTTLGTKQCTCNVTSSTGATASCAGTIASVASEVVQPSCSITYSPARLTLGSTGQVTLTTSNAFSNAASCSCTGLDSVSESFSIPSGTYPQSFTTLGTKQCTCNVTSSTGATASCAGTIASVAPEVVQPSCSLTYSPARLTLGSTGQVTLTTSNAFSNAASCSCTGLDSVLGSFSIPSGTYPQSFTTLGTKQCTCNVTSSTGATASCAGTIASVAPEYACQGSIPTGSVMCAGDDVGASVNQYWQSVGTSISSCTTTRRCEYYRPADDTKDVLYKNGLTLDVYRATEANAPTVVWVHDGGWVWGDKSEEDIVAWGNYLSSKGVSVVSINYTLSPYNGTVPNPYGFYPSPLKDLDCALRWVLVNANEYGLNSNNIQIGGVSAGGHLSLLYSLNQTMYRDNACQYQIPSPKIAKVFSISGPTDLVALKDDRNVSGFINAFFNNKGTYHSEASPITYINKTNKTPLYFLIQAKDDELVPFESQALAFYNKMSTYGYAVGKKWYDTGGHGVWTQSDVKTTIKDFVTAPSVITTSTNITTANSDITTKTITTTAETSPAPLEYTFRSDLAYGSKGSEVIALQNVLIEKGFLAKDGNSGNFYTLTQSALAAYQKANGISPATGYFGPLTRAYMNKDTATIKQKTTEISLEDFVRLLIALQIIPKNKADLALKTIEEK